MFNAQCSMLNENKDEYSQVYSVKRFVEVGGFKSVKFCGKTLHFDRQPINGLVAEGKRPTA